MADQVLPVAFFKSEKPLDQRFQAMLLHDGKELKGHSTGLLGSGLPLLNGRFAGIEVTGEHRLTDTEALAQPLICWGLRGRGVARQDVSKSALLSCQLLPRCTSRTPRSGSPQMRQS